MKRKKRLAITPEFARLVKLYEPRPRLTFIYSDGSGDILPADEDSDKWRDEAKTHAWLDAKPCVTYLNRRGTSDILPFHVWRARARVLAARRKHRTRRAA